MVGTKSQNGTESQNFETYCLLRLSALTTIIGTISEFKPEKEQWVNYKKRLDAWVRINKIDDAFISLVGPEVVDLLVALVSPANIEGKTYAQLSELLQKHYTSGTYELAESYNFDTRYQKESETVSDYIVALKKLSIHSRFGDEEQVKKRLRNRLVAGVCSDAI